MSRVPSNASTRFASRPHPSASENNSNSFLLTETVAGRRLRQSPTDIAFPAATGSSECRAGRATRRRDPDENIVARDCSFICKLLQRHRRRYGDKNARGLDLSADGLSVGSTRYDTATASVGGPPTTTMITTSTRRLRRTPIGRHSAREKRRPHTTSGAAITTVAVAEGVGDRGLRHPRLRASPQFHGRTDERPR